MQDKEFVNQIVNAESAEEAQKLFAARDIEFTLEEVKAIAAGLNNMGDELNEENLEAVAGGVAFSTVVTVVGIIHGTVKIIDTVRKWKW